MRFDLPACIDGSGHSTLPWLGAVKPAMMRSTVDLPQPEGPSSDRNSPRRTLKSRFASASVPFGKVLPTPCSASSEVEVCSAVAGGIGNLSLWPQIEPDLLVDELQRVALAVIEVRFRHAGSHHFVEKIFHARIGHGANAERERVFGIGDVVFFHGVGAIGQQVRG